MASALLSSIRSTTSQFLGSVRRWAASPSSSSDPRSSVLEDLEELERTLKRILAVLHDAEEREIREEAVKLWLKELKEVADNAEDVLDEYHYEVLRAQVEGGASRKRKRVEGDDEEQVSSSLSTIVNVSIPDGMGNRIREIRKRFGEISKDRERLRLREEDGERRVFGALSPPPTSHMVDESSTYGRECDKQKVIDLLFSEGMGINGISVIPIVGKGGLGKTTIAQLVYNDSKVKEYFDLTGWVCVSDDFNVPRLTKAIIESITEESCNLIELSPLQNSLNKKVEGKKVLLVLDDVWNEQQSRWESLRIPFVGAETVKIIVTCRNDSVAKIMQTVNPYHPGYLSEDESWSLFRHYAFAGREYEEQSRLADIGKQIVEKCSGLPLAVKTIGSLLRQEIDEEDSWMEVLQSDLWELDKNNEILASLRLSYNRMPAHLKPCFVYCSIFPKDYVFDKDDLVGLWMAQGYIPPQDRRRMEDIGDAYLSDLLRRSFFDSFDDEFNYYYKMHDMIHDLAKFIAGNECYAIVDKKLPHSPGEVRHLYMEDAREFVKPLDWYNFKALRTLLLRHGYRDPIENHEIIKFPPLLRCLQLRWGRKDGTPNLLRNLKHLRYLQIQSACIKRLPESICLLYHLQTLIVYCYILEELPDDLDKLINLRSFALNSNKIERLPESICLLYHLQTLNVYCDILEELPDGLGNLINLRSFALSSNKIERLPESICQLRNLQTLDLQYCKQLKELPSGIGSLTNLRHLDFQYTQIRCLPAGIGKLTNLQILHGRCELQGGIGVLKDLVNLQGDLCISGLRNLVSIEDAKGGGLKYKHKLERLCLFWDAECKHKHDCHDMVNHGGLHLKAFLEENKDVPADEKREEALLEYLQPPANLKKLIINGYGRSKFPEGLHNFHSLKNLGIYNCPQLRLLSKEGLPANLQYLHIQECQQLISLLLSEEGLPSKLQKLHIEECQQLTSLPAMQNVTFLEALNIKKCPQLRFLSEKGLPANLQYLQVEECQQLISLLLSEEGLPSKLQKLHIEECQQLTSLPAMQNVTSLEALNIKKCPQLRLLSEEGLPANLQYLHIEECQQLISLLLSEEGLPSKLQKLHIKECQQLTSLPAMQNVTSLEALNIKKCPQLRLLSEEGLPANLQYLHIEECQQLISLPGMQNLTSLEMLTITNCPQLRLLSDEGLPSKLDKLRIEDCQQLTSLSGMQNLTSLRKLTIKNCPKLEIMVEDQLSSMPDDVAIIDCPGLRNWCQIQKINCIWVASGNKMTISNTWEKIMRGFDDLTSTEHLCFINSWHLLQARGLFSISILEELTILGCMHNPLITCLPALTCIQSLVIKDCLGVRLLPDELLPSTLKSLVVDSCENLLSLQLTQRNRHKLEELRIVNCPELITVEGLNCLFLIKLTIKQCPQLRLSRNELQLFLPHSEEAENKDTNDDGTQEKQAMSCVMIEHANSAVSPIFGAGIDWNAGRLLQLGLSFGCSSQSSVQINAEPSPTDEGAVSPIFGDATDCNMDQFQQLGLLSGCSSQSPVHNNAELLLTDGGAVSSIFADATDCNVGQFLQLGLPSGSSLQSSIHNNAELLPTDGGAVSSIFADATDCNMDQFLQLGLPTGYSLQSPIHNNAELLN